MTAKHYYGCWTCRLRRKKCDKAQPVCNACKSMDITCYSGVQAPQWMDNDETKAGMLNDLKREIKEKSASRKEKKRARLVKAKNDGQFNGHSYTRGILSTKCGVRDDFITKYLDHVFPFLFPFYKPAIFETGRSWILSLLRQSQIALDSTLSLTAYFFTVALNDAYGSSYADCTDQVWSRLASQADKCFEGMQSIMQTLLRPNPTTTAPEKVHIMESIIQVLVFESIVGKSADWNLHLTPALTLFKQVFETESTHESKMISALFSIGPPVWYKTENDSYIWSPDQAGFRFFPVLLVYIDIIASTALQCDPRLALHHEEVLGDDNGAPVLGFIHIRLSSVVGCQNSVLGAIGEVASLDSWKKTRNRRHGDIKQDLTGRASCILAKLEAVRSSLDGDERGGCSKDSRGLLFLPYDVRATSRGPSTTATMIWSHAARIYLLSVVDDFRPLDAAAAEYVSKILELVRTVPSNHFRTLAWPLCVAGCFASVDHQRHFDDIFAAKTELEMIGSLREAWQVMHSVWKRRADTNEAPLDLASRLSILGKPVLLI